MYDNLLLYGSHIVVPSKLRKETLAKIQRCQARVKTSVWWPGVSQAVEVYVKNCSHCQKRYVPPKEPLISSTLPSHPWDRVATDLFELNIVIVNYFLRYPELSQLKSTTSVIIVKTLKANFARHGVPSVLFLDNGPLFNSTAFKKFSSQYHFSIISSMLLAASDTPKAMG